MPKVKHVLTKEKRNLYNKLIVESELRNCKSKAEKCDILNRKYGFKRCELIELDACTGRIWDRMMISRKHNRSVGIRGRPRLLSPTSEQTLVQEALLQAEEGTPLSVKKLGEMVKIFLKLLSIYYFSF